LYYRIVQDRRVSNEQITESFAIRACCQMHILRGIRLWGRPQADSVAAAADRNRQAADAGAKTAPDVQEL
jgi:hypothetical protein